MSNNIDIKIRAKTEGAADVKILKEQLTAMGNIESFKKLKKDIKSTKEAWETAQKKVAALAKEIAQAEKPTKDLATKFKAAKKEAGALKTSFTEQREALHNLRPSLKNAGINTKYLKSEQKKLAAEIDKSRKKISKYGSSVESAGKLSKGFIAAMSVVSITAIGVAFKKLASAIFDTGIHVQALNLAYKTIFDTSQLAREEFEFLRETASNLGMEFYSTADAYKSIAASAKETSLKGDGVRKVFVGISEASMALGLSAESTEGVLRAVSQMMGKGKVSAEELRQQMGEHLPGAFNLAAESMGMSTQEFDKLMSTGKIFTEDFLPRFADSLHEKFSKAAEDAAGNAQQSFNQFKTAWTDLKAEMSDSGFLDSVTTAFKNLTEELNKPETIILAKQLGKAMGTIIEWSAKGVGGFTKFALASSQFSEGLRLVNEGLIDYKTFVGSDFIGRQKLIDDALKNSSTITKEFADTLESKLKQKFKDVSEETGVTIKTMDDLEEAVESGAVSFDEASGTWVGAEKKKQDALKATLNDARDTATQMSQVQNDLVELVGQSSDAMIATIKDRAEKGELSEGEAAKQIVAINQEKYKQILSFAEDNLANVKALYGEDSMAYKTTAKEVEKAAGELKKYKIKAAKDVTAALKSELKEQLSEEKRLTNELTSLRDKLVSDQSSRDDDIRGIRQRSMTDAEKQADLEAQAYEKITKANDALKEGNYNRAEDYAKQAKSIAKGLGDEDRAVRLVEKSWDTIAKSTKEQEKAKRGELDKTISKIKDLNSEIQKIEEKRDVEITANTSMAQTKLELLRQTLDDIQDKTVTVTTVHKDVSSGSGSDGGDGYARGGNLPGYGGGDVIPAMLEPGEWIIRKESVKKYGNAFMAQLNAGLLGFKTGGLIPSFASAKGYNTGGAVSADAYPEDVQSLIEEFYEFLNNNVAEMSALTYNVNNLWKFNGRGKSVTPYDYNDWFTEDSEKPNISDANDLIASYNRASSAVTGTPPIKIELDNLLDELNKNGLSYNGSLVGSDSWPQFKAGGLVESLSNLNLSMPKFQIGGLVDGLSKPNISMPSIPSLPNAGGSNMGTARTVNHTVSLNINGKSVGPLSGDQATIGDFISQLKKAQRVT